ncbi:MAG: TonB-dependent receptor, partial [Myxococcales bacterium]|nr:TonB-dependent receptor [Myxococcales bacterium]
EELETAPGTLGDPLRALQNMPGLMRTPAGLGALVIRGAAPWQSQVFFAEHPIPRAFHVLALASVVPAPAVERIDYTPSNFASRYGNATGGVVAIQPRALGSVGATPGVHGYGELSLIGLGASIEGPAGDGAFLAAARTGYYDAVIAVVNALDAGPVVLPGYFDYQASVEQRLRGGGSVTARLLGAGDRIKPPNVEFAAPYQRDFAAQFHRVDLVYRRRLGPTQIMISPAFRFDAERLSVDAESREPDARREYNVLLRAELERLLGARARLLVGTDMQVTPYTLTLAGESFAVTAPSSDDLVDARPRGLEAAIGLYVEPTLTLGRLTLVPGARASAFTLDQEYAFAVDPRLRARVELADAWAARAAVGQYSRGTHEVQSGAYFGQEPGASSFFEGGGRIPIPPSYYQLFDPTTLLGGPRLRLGVERALQASAGVEYRPSRAWTVDVTGFVLRRRFPPFSTATSVRQSEVFTYGAELSLRRHLVGRLYGWISYSLQSSSVRSRSSDAPADEDPTALPSIYDQRHNLNLAASYRLPRGWRIGGRFRLASGLPFTPIIGSITLVTQPAGPLYIPISGASQSERFPVFHQLDARVDKTWVLARVRVSAYLDVQNVYNAQNIELYAYRRDYRARVGVPGLPVLPAVGVRVDY